MASYADASWVDRLAAVADDVEPTDDIGPIGRHLAWLGASPRLGAEQTLRVDFDGAIDVDRFTRAFAEVTSATAILDAGPGATQIVRAPERTWASSISARARTPLDLTASPYASTLYVDGDRTLWTLRVHEKVVDAESCVRIANRVALAYAGRVVPHDDTFVEYLRAERVQRWAEAEPHADDDDAPLSFYGEPARWNRLGVHRETHPVTTTAGLIPLWAATAAYVARATGRALTRTAVPARLGRHKGIGAMTEWFPLELEVDPDDTGAALVARAYDAYESAKAARLRIDETFGRPADVRISVADLRLDPFGEVTARAEFAPSLLDRNASPRVQARDFASLSVHLHTTKDGTSLSCDLADDAFPRSAPTRVAYQLALLLDGVVRDPERPLQAIDLRTEAERRRSVPRSSPPAPSVAHRILANAETSPQAVAAEDAGGRLGYEVLVRRASQLARHLITLGAKPEERVAICLDRTVDLPVAMLAVHLSGAAFVPLDPTHPRRRTALVLEDAAPTIVLTESKHLSGLRPPANARVVSLDADREDIELHDDAPVDTPAPPPDRLAYVIYTSGSTGRPKGVQIEHGAFASFLRAMLDVVELGATDRLLAVTTPTFDIALMELMLPLYVGGTVVVAPERATKSPRHLAQWIERGVTYMQATPSTWSMLVQDGWRGADIVALCGGEQFPIDLAAPLMARTLRTVNVYGPTEATIWATAHELRGREQTRVPIGHPFAGVEAFVVSNTGCPAPDGMEGELYLAGPQLARGYLGRDEETRRRFVAHPADATRRAYRTGDLARRRRDGSFECLGRLDDQVKVRGFRIELGELEAVIRRHPCVIDAVADVREDRPGDRRLAAFVVFEGDGGPPMVRSLRELLAEHLPSYMVPSNIVALPSLPLTPNGKVDRRVLRAPPTPEKRDRAAVVRPRDDRELRIAAMWRDLLGVEEVGVTDRFFDLGGHSLMAVSMLSAIENTFGTTLDPGPFFETPTIETIAAALDVEHPDHGASVIPLEPGGEQTPLFCICGLHLYQDLARAVGVNRPVYGILAPSEVRFLADGDTDALPEVPALARQYTEAILATCPPGPIALCGVSFGGLLAYETAQQLRSEGYQIRVVVLLDTILKVATEASRRRWVVNRIHALVERGRQAGRSKVATLAQDRMRAYDARADRYEAMLPRYAGDVVVVRAQDGDAGLDLEETLGWSNVVTGRLEVYRVPGSHLGILSGPNAVQLARCITPHLDGYWQASIANGL